MPDVPFLYPKLSGNCALCYCTQAEDRCTRAALFFFLLKIRNGEGCVAKQNKQRCVISALKKWVGGGGGRGEPWKREAVLHSLE